ncbi:Hypothetical protein PHPALM_2597 [Phytophthora palmivora]|uniref:Chromo domain-containing protein n=1 Tax=Phytophthora palmivora TaxID=4796 RepID=A0A2P4YPD3_9STRA|nr:Hypothetical protein PHPALM_2597 [Phytophthora palmivora]
MESSQGHVQTTTDAPPTAFYAFFQWCQQHLRERGTWGHIERGNTSNVGDVVKRLLDAVPQARITKARLIETVAQGEDAGEAEWVLPSGTDLSGQPTYQMHTILDDRRVDGRVVFLTSWEPTWEPAVNLPSNDIKKYRKRKRTQVERAYIEAEAQED